jgi:hypothetical protein
VALEKRAEPNESILQQIRAREAWLEVAPAADRASRFATRWHYLPGYPAAAWNVEVPAWPQAVDAASPARPTVQLWWNADQHAAPAAVLKRGHDFKTLAELSGRTLRISGDELRLEAVCVERHIVQTRPAVREEQSCLMVRASHASQQPVWTRVTGVHPAGQEHRYYASIGSYTGLFWPVTTDEAESLLTSLSVVSLNDFKREAQQRGCHLKLSDAPPPSPNDFRPSALELP